MSASRLSAVLVHGVPCPQRGFCVGLGHLPSTSQAAVQVVLCVSWRMNSLFTSHRAVEAECVGS